MSLQQLPLPRSLHPSNCNWPLAKSSCHQFLCLSQDAILCCRHPSHIAIGRTTPLGPHGQLHPPIQMSSYRPNLQHRPTASASIQCQ